MAAGSIARRRRRNRKLRRIKPERRFLDRQNPLETLSNDEVFERFRFRPNTIIFLTNLFMDQLQHPTDRSSSLTPLQQMLIALRFFATGAFCLLIGDSINVSKSTAGRAVRAVSSLLSSKDSVKRFIKFPDEDRKNMKYSFFKLAGFPNVVGCVDGTQIRIKSPSKNENDFLNRKGYHSLNVQAICDHKFKFIDCVARWPGSVHDSRIFRESGICRSFESGNYKGFLLGDSGYALKPFLLTPYLVPNTAAKENFNKAHSRTRVLIEQSFGILKKRFPCLQIGIRTNPERACQIILACIVLHNIGLDQGDIVQDLDGVDVNADDDNSHTVLVSSNDSGKTVRDHIAETYFSV